MTTTTAAASQPGQMTDWQFFTSLAASYGLGCAIYQTEGDAGTWSGEMVERNGSATPVLTFAAETSTWRNHAGDVISGSQVPAYLGSWYAGMVDARIAAAERMAAHALAKATDLVADLLDNGEPDGPYLNAARAHMFAAAGLNATAVELAEASRARNGKATVPVELPIELATGGHTDDRLCYVRRGPWTPSSKLCQHRAAWYVEVQTPTRTVCTRVCDEHLDEVRAMPGFHWARALTAKTA